MLIKNISILATTAALTAVKNMIPTTSDDMNK